MIGRKLTRDSVSSMKIFIFWMSKFKVKKSDDYISYNARLWLGGDRQRWVVIIVTTVVATM